MEDDNFTVRIYHRGGEAQTILVAAHREGGLPVYIASAMTKKGECLAEILIPKEDTVNTAFDPEIQAAVSVLEMHYGPGIQVIDSTTGTTLQPAHPLAN